MRLLLLATGFSVIAAAAPAQESPAPGVDRRGFWFSLGAGLGSRGLSCYDCIGLQREQGLTTTFRLGGTLSSQVTMGVNLVGWIKPLNDPGRGKYGVFSALMGVAQVYPFARYGFFVQGGGGYVVDVVEDDLVLDSPGMQLGIGFDVPAGRGFSFTPQINYLRTIDGGNLVSSLYQFGIAATWH
jgi:hypothetical protein